ncbi:MAG TPA: hypothetical protein VFR37_09535 [Longimicrobium sp.]|nr:hypothetical protein [Longimicrobium sp.]
MKNLDTGAGAAYLWKRFHENVFRIDFAPPLDLTQAPGESNA